MSLDAIVKWVSGNVGVSLVAAFFALGLLANFVRPPSTAGTPSSLPSRSWRRRSRAGRCTSTRSCSAMVTAFAEIIGKFRDEPLKSLQTPQAVLYHLLNGAISVFALKVFFLTFGEPMAQIDQIKAVTASGFGSMPAHAVEVLQCESRRTRTSPSVPSRSSRSSCRSWSGRYRPRPRAVARRVCAREVHQSQVRDRQALLRQHARRRAGARGPERSRPGPQGRRG